MAKVRKLKDQLEEQEDSTSLEAPQEEIIPGGLPEQEAQQAVPTFESKVAPIKKRRHIDMGG